MSTREPDHRRTLSTLAAAFVLLAAGVLVLAALALRSPLLRGADGVLHVWLGAVAAAPWLLSAAATSWRARYDGSVRSGLLVTSVLLAAWVVLDVLAAVLRPGTGDVVLPLLAFATVPVLLLVLTARAAAALRRG